MTVDPLIRLIIPALLLASAITTEATPVTILSGGQKITVDSRAVSFLKAADKALKSKRYDVAIRHLTAALQMKPDSATASVIYDQRALAHTQKAEFNEAMADANEAIRINPRFFGGYLERGIVYRRTGDPDKAIGDYNIAIRLNPNFANTYYDRALAYAYKGEHDQAIRDNTEAIRRNPKDPSFYNNRAADYHAIGNFDQAIADCTEVIRLDPNDPHGYFGRGANFEDAGNLEKARADYERAVRCTPRDASEYTVRGQAYSKKADYRAAASDFEQAVALARRDSSLLNSLAWFKATCPDDSFRNGKEALANAKKACDLVQWQHPDPIDTLAAAYAELGDFDEAVKYQTRAVKMRGVYPWARKKMQERLDLYRQRKPYRAVPKV